MDLEATSGRRTPEVLHVQQDLDVKDWDRAGSTCKKTKTAVMPMPGTCRVAHLGKLKYAPYEHDPWMI